MGGFRAVKIRLVSISSRKAASSGAARDLSLLYQQRAARYTPCEAALFPSENVFLASLVKDSGRVRPVVWLADSRGSLATSEELAADLMRCFDGGVQQLVLAIGPADGWSATALARADRTISFGRITLPHELAAVVAAEQMYRALTIRAGHPYHSGH
jgi:23S rRNA (pseudouridine1915-N3)-methyltransferase